VTDSVTIGCYCVLALLVLAALTYMLGPSAAYRLREGRLRRRNRRWVRALRRANRPTSVSDQRTAAAPSLGAAGVVVRCPTMPTASIRRRAA
jgi:hypothetical protein